MGPYFLFLWPYFFHRWPFLTCLSLPLIRIMVLLFYPWSSIFLCWFFYLLVARCLSYPWLSFCLCFFINLYLTYPWLSFFLIYLIIGIPSFSPILSLALFLSSLVLFYQPVALCLSIKPMAITLTLVSITHGTLAPIWPSLGSLAHYWQRLALSGTLLLSPTRL